MPTDTVKPANPAAPVSAKPAMKPAVAAKPPRAAALKASVAKPAVAKAAPVTAPATKPIAALAPVAKPVEAKSAPVPKAPKLAPAAAKPVPAKPAPIPAPAKPAAVSPAAKEIAPVAKVAAPAKPVVPAPLAKALVEQAATAKPEPRPAVAAPAATPVELPKAINDIASTGLNQAREGYATLKESAEALSAGFETGTQAAARGVQDFSKTLIDAIQANTDATLGFLKALTGVRTISEAIEIQSSHARRQFETVSSQAKTLAGIAQRTATETTEPVRKALDRTLRRSA